MPAPPTAAGQSTTPTAAGGDLVREALDRARAAAAVRRAQSAETARADASRAAAGRRGSRRVPGPPRDPGEPVRFGEAVAGLLADRGWETDLAVGAVLGRWDALVGAELAAHCSPVSLIDGELVLQAESTAWATQVRLLQRSLLDILAAELGHGLVRAVTVHGPVAPSWGHGPRRVKGRGPRDTYG